jgi:hypothetical protein
VKKIIFLIISLQLCISLGYSSIRKFTLKTTASDSGLTDLTKKIDDLVLLGKFWGFIKYHHPNVIKGNFDWDQQLIKILPAYIASKNIKERNEILKKWMEDLGAFHSNNLLNDSLPRVAKLKPDLNWIYDSKFSPEFVKTLTELQKSSSESQQYIQLKTIDGINYFTISNEKPYLLDELTLPLKLIAVFRYWNIVEYWYPYKNLAKDNWNNCLKEFINDVLATKSERDYAFFIQKMVAAIKDSHAVLVSGNIEDFNDNWQLPLTIKFLENKAVITSVDPLLSNSTDIKVGNILTSIGGIPISSLLDSKSAFISASNRASFLREAAKLLTRTKDTISQIITIDNKNEERKHVIKNNRYNLLSKNKIYDFPYQRDSSFFLLKENILYINIGNLKRNQVPKLYPYLKTVKGIIFDDRQYPKDPAGDLLSNFLLPHKTPLAIFSNPVKGQPGIFQFSSPMIIGSENSEYFKGKVIVLVNEETQSTGEFFAMLIKLSPNASVVGSMTAGADGNVSPLFVLPRGFFTKLTALGVYYPNGAETQQIGIVADYPVHETITGLRNQIDEILQKGISVITDPKSGK